MKFSGYPDVDWKSVFSRSIIESQCQSHKSNLLIKIASCFFVRKQSFKFTKNEKSKILFYQAYYKRKSYNDQMDRVSALVPSDLLRGEALSRRKFVGMRFLLMRVIPWYIELQKTKYPLWVKFNLLSELISLSNIVDYCNSLQINNYNLLVTFCDSIIDEAYITEFFKNKRIKTATLQHGQFSAHRENKLINSGVEIRTLKSDYFLTWNQMTIDECKKQGNVKAEMVFCGILGYIGQTYKQSSNPNNKIFGIVINHQFFEQENIELIKCANKLAHEIGYKYYLKLHPNYEDHHFDSMVDPDCYLGNVKKGIPILEYANMCEFSIVSSSSVFCELVYLKHKVFRYSTQSIEDKYKDVPYGLTFSGINDVVSNFSKGFEPQQEKSLFSYLCGTEEVTKKYTEFLNKFL